MNNITILRNFGTIYLWIFVIEVLQVCGDVDYRTDTEMDRSGSAVVPALLMKPYAYHIFDDDYTDDLLNERKAIATTPIRRTLGKQPFYYRKHLPLLATKSKEKNGNSMTSREITFENLNDFDSYKIRNTFWPKLHYEQQHYVKGTGNSDNENKQRRHNLQQLVVVRSSDGEGSGVDKQKTSMTNIRYKQNGILPIPIIMAKYFKTKGTRTTKKSNTPFNNDANAAAFGKGVMEGDDVKENLFPLKDDNTLNELDDGASYENDDRVDVFAFDDEEYSIANSNGNGNKSFNYANNNEANTNYLVAQSSDNDHDRDSHHLKDQYSGFNMSHKLKRITAKPHDKRAKPSVGHTPFLPAVSGGAITNLGKFFRDLSKNVHVSEQYHWDAEEQKLLEGDPNFGDIHHHLTKPNAATDQQTAEWIKAIRFYRPSQKIRSLVAMNPHGQWAHSSQFIDPNYMWVGLGK